MKKKLLFIFVLSISCAGVFSQTRNSWKSLSKSEALSAPNAKPRNFPENSNYFTLDIELVKAQLFSAPKAFSQSNIEILIPDMAGVFEKFRIWEDSNFAAGLQSQYPGIKAYSGKGIDDPTAILKISIAPSGIQTMVLRAGKKAEFIEACTTDGLKYALFNSSKNNNEGPFLCGTKEQEIMTDENLRSNRTNLSSTQTLKTFRLALSCTAEYAAYFGGTVEGALAGMNATMTRVNGILENDLAVKLELISNEADIIFTDAVTDPYDNADIGTGFDPATVGTWNAQLQATLTTVIGDDNYDIGHLLGSTFGKGDAGCIGCICDALKGSGYSSPFGVPEGDGFDVDMVIHEFGHQLGANHIFSFQFEGTGAQVEPGSGSTIMGYAGITQAFDVQWNSDAYFNAKSIQQVQSNLSNKTCGVDTALDNVPPTVSAGADYTIPKSTPFILTGTATPNNPALTYTWEQGNSATLNMVGDNSVCFPTKVAGPNFRSVLPGNSPTRYFPALTSVLGNTLTTTYESVSDIARALKFVFTARDNNPAAGQTASDSAIITVNADIGPFDVTSQDSEDISWTQGSTQTITWAVNNTTSLAGSSNVDILLSTDGGLTYPIILAGATPNDGSEDIVVPNLAAAFCRVMVKPTGNVYYDINTKMFSIGYTTVCNTYTNSTIMAVPDSSGNGTSTISVPVTGIVTDVNLSLDVSLTNYFHLLVTLQSPDNTSDVIWQDCFLGSEFNFTFDDAATAYDCITNFDVSSGTFKPHSPLTVFNGVEASGTWTLTATDDIAEDVGQLSSWSINVCEKVLVPLGVDDFGHSNISIYPNPARAVVNISVPEGTSLPDSFAVYNMLGQAVQSAKISSVADLAINTAYFSNGVYFIKIYKGNAAKTVKFIKD
jgi:subtilisin-like proprotein convertase family protein